MRQRQAQLDAAGARVWLVSFETLPRTRAHLRYHKLPYPTLVDEPRAVYRSLDMDRGPWWRIYGPRVVWRYLLAYLRGERLRIRGDTFQRGGDVLVDGDGIIRLLHVGVDSFDRPMVDDLLTQLHALPWRT